MSEQPYTPPRASLFGEEPPEAPAPKPQGVVDLVFGLFTEPSRVFQHLRRAPSWVGPLVLFLGLGLLGSLAWAHKVDQEAMVRQNMAVLEQAFGMKIPKDAVDKELDKVAGKPQPYLTATAGAVLLPPVFLLVMAGILLGFAKAAGEDEGVGFRHAWSVAWVHGLVMLPSVMLAVLVCLVRPVGGAPNYMSLAPTVPAYFLQPENPWLRGLLSLPEPFYLFSFVTLYLGLKHTLGLKVWARATVLGLFGFFGMLARFVGGMF